MAILASWKGCIMQAQRDQQPKHVSPKRHAKKVAERSLQLKCSMWQTMTVFAGNSSFSLACTKAEVKFEPASGFALPVARSSFCASEHFELPKWCAGPRSKSRSEATFLAFFGLLASADFELLHVFGRDLCLYWQIDDLRSAHCLSRCPTCLSCLCRRTLVPK